MPSRMADLIIAEADRMRCHLRGALEYGDLVGTGWLAALTAPTDQPMGALRIRIRGAIHDCFRREWRQLGRVPRAIRWPVYWPLRYHTQSLGYHVLRCVDCRARIETGQRCLACKRERRLVKQRVYNRAYYQRMAS